MSAGRYSAPAGFVPLAEARKRLGVSHTKMWTMVKQGVLAVYEDPRDRRVRLVREDEIENLGLPRPILRADRPVQGEREEQT